MESGFLLALAVFVLAFGLVSRRIEKSIVTPAMAFVGFGLLVSPHTFGLLDTDVPHEWLETVAQWTLVLVLFTDASRINLRSLTRDYHLPLRLLGVGLPLTVIAGAAVAVLVFPGLSIWEAGLLAAILAPTDAALGIAVMTNRRVPMRTRQALNVESGLNDGLCLPIVLIFMAGAGTVEHTESGMYWLQFVLFQLTLGPIIGLLIGFGGGRLVRYAVETERINDAFLRLSSLSLAALAFLCAEEMGGNGFIAAFCAGLAMGNTARKHCKPLYEFAETEGQLLALIAFLLFGTQYVWPTLVEDSGLYLIYGALSLTVIRMLPVALSLLGARLRLPTTLFLGWFGPRGLASLVYALMMMTTLETPEGKLIFDVVIVTVTLSVFAHGISASPLAVRYGAWTGHAVNAETAPEHREVFPHPLRIGRHS